MSLAQIELLYAKNIKFFDFTYSQTLPEFPNITLAPIPTTPVHQTYVRSLLPNLSAAQMRTTVTDLSNFFTRYYTSQTGEEAATYIFNRYRSYAGSRTDITVMRYTHSWRQPSIVATILGNGPNRAERVVIGGHEDSVGTSSTARAPGSDDDASGTAVVLEVFRVLVASGYRPDRTIDFMAYAGEEAGLLGSQAIANSFRSQGLVVHAALQFDMTGYFTTRQVKIITDFTDASLNAFMRTLFTTYSAIPWANQACGYACSDHASWNRAGYRSTFPHEFATRNPYIHSQNDLIAYIDFAYSLEFAKAGLGGVVELAERA